MDGRVHCCVVSWLRVRAFRRKGAGSDGLGWSSLHLGGVVARVRAGCPPFQPLHPRSQPLLPYPLRGRRELGQPVPQSCQRPSCADDEGELPQIQFLRSVVSSVLGSLGYELRIRPA